MFRHRAFVRPVPRRANGHCEPRVREIISLAEYRLLFFVEIGKHKLNVDCFFELAKVRSRKAIAVLT